MFRFKISVLLSLLLATSSIASDDKPDKSNFERGIRFGDYNSSKTYDENTDENNLGKVLMLILKENEKHTKLLTDIRNILQNEFDPKPKEIIVNGKKCIENSSAECFKMPMINEIKKIPAIAEAYKNPTKENIKKRELWYAKYFQMVMSDVYLKQLSIRELGEKYPLTVRQPGAVVMNNGFDHLVSNKFRQKMVEKFNDRFEYNIFIGMNPSLDAMSLISIAKTLKEMKGIKVNLIFISNEAKQKWEKQYSNFYNTKYFEKTNVFIQPEAFEEFKIYMTPSIYVKDLVLEKDTFIYRGRFYTKTLISKMIDYMIQNKIIKRQDLNLNKAWGDDEDNVKKYYKDFIGVKYNE